MELETYLFFVTLSLDIWIIKDFDESFTIIWLYGIIGWYCLVGVKDQSLDFDCEYSYFVLILFLNDTSRDIF